MTEDLLARLSTARLYALTLCPDSFGWSVNLTHGPDGPVDSFGRPTLEEALLAALDSARDQAMPAMPEGISTERG